ncbi:DUF302 domain-containing protein [Methylovirgula sp. 4M-Z18]
MSKAIETSFDEAAARVTEALKVGVDYAPYMILGACNPHLAWRALQVEDKIDTMPPCNVVVREERPGPIEVTAIDPVASMSAIGDPKLAKIADGVRHLLTEVIQQL